jgi:hypothetical protein
MTEVTEKTRALCWLPRGHRWFDTFSRTEQDGGFTRVEEYTRLAGRLAYLVITETRSAVETGAAWDD